MSLCPISTTKAVVGKYLDYLETTFALSDSGLHRQLAEELRQPGKFSRGPVLEATPPFEQGVSIDELIDEGVLSAEFNKLQVPDLPTERKLYVHQEKAIRKLVQGKRNVIVATGTGSGKTETFLLPILNHLFRQKEQRKLEPGVRALLLYPMNALANDQLKRMRKLLRNYPDITFGSYTGETEREEKRAVERFKLMNPREKRLANELLSRDMMKESPPHILLTNYAMLEYLLLRPDDHVFFDGQHARDWRFIVIDEAHTYAGAKGVEMAMLLRRLKERVVQSKPGSLQCIGTSATLGGDEGDFKAVARFGEGLFSESFLWEDDNPEHKDVIVGQKKDLAITTDSWGVPDSQLYSLWKAIVEAKNGDKMSALLKSCLELSVPQHVAVKAQQQSQGVWEQFLYAILVGDGRVIKLQQELQSEPGFVEGLALKVFGEEEDRLAHLIDLVSLAQMAKPSEQGQPLVPARYHLFIRAIEGGFVSLLPEKKLYLERRENIYFGEERYPVFEGATCRGCSALYLVGETEITLDSKALRQPGRRFLEDTANLEHYLLLEDRELAPDNEDEIIAAPDVNVSGLRFKLCGSCGSIAPENSVATPCKCKKPYFAVVKVPAKSGLVHKCPACGLMNPVGSVLRRFSLGAEAVTSVLGTALYQQIPEEMIVKVIEDTDDEWGNVNKAEEAKNPRRLLIFSDSRQDAAFFATYLESSYMQILHRRLLIMTLEKYRQKVLTNKWCPADLASFVQKELRDLNLFPEMSLQQLESEAWKWVMHELIVKDRNIGLESLGLFAFKPSLPPNWLPPKALQNFFQGFSTAECADVIMVLMDTMRKIGAVRFPDAISPTDPYFAPRNREYYFKENMSADGTIHSWCPTTGSVSNSRLDYVMRIINKVGLKATREESVELLANIWSKLLVGENAAWRQHFSSHHESGRYGDVYCLKPDYWELQPAVVDESVAWYRCNKCTRLTLYNVRTVCTTYRCDGELVKCEPSTDLQNNHYRRLYLDTLPMAMHVSEHTAQLTTERAAEIQKLFYDGLVNVLSCSTTFELGVDVGELETVFMRNVPPTAANYIQRAGRAGRRTGSAAFVLTFAQRRSHDFTHFNDPIGIIRGEIKPPYIDIANEKIIRRHMYATALAMFWKLHPHYFGQTKAFFCGEQSAREELKELLATKPQSLGEALTRIVPSHLWDRLGIDEDWSWVGGLMDDNHGVLSKAEQEFLNDISQLEAIEMEFSKSLQHGKASSIRKTINTLERRSILSFASQRNIIPKYGFPVDVIELQIHHHTEEAKGLQLDRDLRIALSEYAPGSQVVAGGKLWTSRYLKKLPDREPIKYDYAICDYCGLYQSSMADKETAMDKCRCGEKYGKNKGTFITPEFGFLADKPERPTMSKPERTFSTRKYFSQVGRVIQEDELSIGSHLLSLRTGEDGQLAVVNSAGYRGFRVCQSCGYSTVMDNNPAKAHISPWGKKCQGKAARFSLGHEFKTDVLQIWFPEYNDSRPGFWHSLLYGLLEGACGAFDIDRQDIDGCLYPYKGDPTSPALVLCDDVPGGAGHVKRIAEGQNLTAAIQRSWEIVSRCECGGDAADTSCYGCLRSYSNQFCHDELQRGYVLEFFGQLLEGR